MTLNMKIIAVSAGCLMLLSWILYVVINVLPAWSKSNENQSDRIVIGLWRVCTTASSTTTCSTIDCSSNTTYTNSTCSEIRAARAFITLACVMSIISSICLFVSLATAERLHSIMTIIGKVLAIACLISGIIGVAVGIDSLTHLDSEITLSWSASSIIGIIVIVMNFLGSIVAIIAK